MDTQTLRIFVAVAQEGSMSRAAEKLFLTQAAISLQIKQLQYLLDCTLFERTARGMKLTEDGTTLLTWAQKAIAAHQDFKHAAQRLKNREPHEIIKIGTILDPEFIRLGLFLRELQEAAPHIETSLHHAVSGESLKGVENRSLDVGFYLGSPEIDIQKIVGARDTELFEVRHLTHFTYRVIAPVGWGSRIAGQDWAELANMPWIQTPPSSVHSRLLSKIFADVGVQPKRVAMVDQEASMLDLVRAGVGLSLARDTIALHESRVRGLAVSDQVSVPCTLSFIYLRERMQEPAIEYAWAALNAVWLK